MRYENVYHITTFVPPNAVEKLVEAIGKVVRLQYGNYDRVAWWSAVGTEQFRPLAGSKPTQGKRRRIEKTCSVRLEFVIPRNPALLDKVMKSGIVPLKTHPWEEPVVLVTELQIVVRQPKR